MAYDYSARAYLKRAEDLIASGDGAALFYAAFELRCGIEARMRQYLDAWQDVNKKMKIGWRMADLHRSLERSFRLGHRYARWAVHDAGTGELRICFYYTPVTPALKKMGEQLGDYLHVLKGDRTYDELWWDSFRALLFECAQSLRVATSGIMIGPALLNGDNRVHMRLEIPGDLDKQAFLQACGIDGNMSATHASYPDTLPVNLEPQAVMWRD